MTLDDEAIVVDGDRVTVFYMRVLVLRSRERKEGGDEREAKVVKMKVGSE